MRFGSSEMKPKFRFVSHLMPSANVHVLYPENTKESVLQFIKDELVGYCQNGQYLCDQIGIGSIKI